LKAKQKTIKNYRERFRQAERSAEFALSETLRDIIVQEQDHEIDLKDARAYEIVIRSKSK
jgi:bacterioferritin